MNKFIKELGFDLKCKKGDYIPLELVFKLEYKSKGYNRHEFVYLICKNYNIQRPIIEQQQRFEHEFRDKLTDVLQPFGYKIICQKSVFKGKYRIDFYIKSLNLAIEYDEAQHFVEPQKSEDIKRQKEIEIELGCEFVRLNYKNTDAYNIGLVMKKIFDIGQALQIR